MENRFIEKIKNFLQNIKNLLHKDEEVFQEDVKIYSNQNVSWLEADKVYITDNIYIRIPTVREVLNNEEFYLSVVSALTGSPFQFMVQLDEMNIDYTTISNYQLFIMFFSAFAKKDLSIIFGDLYTLDYETRVDTSNDTIVLYSEENGIEYKIDELIYTEIVKTLRKINDIKEVKFKPGNDAAKAYLLEKEKRKFKRLKNKPFESQLETLIIALVNRPEFKYNYEQTLNLSIYQFYQSLKQIQTSISFDNTMIGVFAGTVDTSKMTNKQDLSWIQLTK